MDKSRDAEGALVPSEPALIHSFEPPPSARSAAVRRAGLATLGSAIAVLPLFALRLALLLALVGLTRIDAGWATYLPFEFLVPFLTGLAVLRRRPAMATLAFSLRVFVVSVLVAPLLLAFAMSQEFFRHFADVSAFEQAWMSLFGTVPLLGALGLAGLVFAGFPLLVFAFAVTAGLDALYCRRHRQQLDDLERSRQIMERMKAGFYDVPGLPEKEKEAMGRDFEALQGELQRLAAALPAASEEGRLARVLQAQLPEALGAYARVARLLRQKLSPSELTYQRYLASARHVYQSLVQHLRNAAQVAAAGAGVAGRQGNDELRQLIASNDEGIRVLRETAEAIARMKVQRGEATLDLAAAAKDLEELARRADRYS
jgi:hypothetical protein